MGALSLFTSEWDTLTVREGDFGAPPTLSGADGIADTFTYQADDFGRRHGIPLGNVTVSVEY